MDIQSSFIATMLAQLKHGTFASLETTKIGKVVGGKRYGDDRVQTLIISGFSYPEMIRKSQEILSMTTDEVLSQIHDLDYDLVKEAKAELLASYSKTLSGTNESTSGHAYEPLIKDGVTVVGANLYKCVSGSDHPCHCRDCSGDEKAPKSGTIYLTGRSLWSKILVPGKNGKAPEPKSKPLTLAKKAISENLPASKFVMYSLAPDQDFILRAGKMALETSMANGMPQLTLSMAE